MPNSKADDTTHIKTFKLGSIEFEQHVYIDRIRCYQVDQKNVIVLLHCEALKGTKITRVIFMSLDKGIMFEYDCCLEHIMDLTTSIAKQYPSLRFAGCTLAGIVSLSNSLIQQHDTHDGSRDVLRADAQLTDTHLLTRCKDIDVYTAKDIITSKQQDLHVSGMFSFSPVHLLTERSNDSLVYSSYFMS